MRALGFPACASFQMIFNDPYSAGAFPPESERCGAKVRGGSRVPAGVLCDVMLQPQQWTSSMATVEHQQSSCTERVE